MSWAEVDKNLLHANDPRRDDRALIALEEAIEDRAHFLIKRYGLSEDYAWQRAQDELCPQDKYDARGIDTHHDLAEAECVTAEDFGPPADPDEEQPF